MSFDFAVTTEDAEPSNNDADNEDVPDFVSNETGDLYLASVIYKRLQDAFLKQMDLEELKVYSDDTLEDAPRLLGEHKDAHPQQKLHLVSVLFKSTAGKLQLENDHAIGLNNSMIPSTHEEVQSDHSYALWSSDLPTITTEALTDEEVSNCEELGIDLSKVSIHQDSAETPILSVWGERLPIAVEEGTEVMDALKILQKCPDEPSAYTEDGFRESSHPEVFNEVEGELDEEIYGDDTEEQSTDEDSTESKYPDFDLASNPERVNEVSVNALRGHNGSPKRLHVTNIDSERTIQLLLKHETEADNTRSSAVQRLKERRNALKGNDEEEPSESEAPEENDEGDDDDGTKSLDELAKLFDLSSIEKDAVQFRTDKKGDFDSYEEAVKSLDLA
jgi:hypothetical protein